MRSLRVVQGYEMAAILRNLVRKTRTCGVVTERMLRQLNTGFEALRRQNPCRPAPISLFTHFPFPLFLQLPLAAALCNLRIENENQPARQREPSAKPRTHDRQAETTG